MKKVKAVLIGTGGRGLDYSSYAFDHSHEIQFEAVAEPDAARREKFCTLHNISDGMCFSSWEELLEKPRMTDAILICTQDRMHFSELSRLEKKVIDLNEFVEELKRGWPI